MVSNELVSCPFTATPQVLSYASDGSNELELTSTEFTVDTSSTYNTKIFWNYAALLVATGQTRTKSTTFYFKLRFTSPLDGNHALTTGL